MSHSDRSAPTGNLSREARLDRRHRLAEMVKNGQTAEEVMTTEKVKRSLVERSCREFKVKLPRMLSTAQQRRKHLADLVAKTERRLEDVEEIAQKEGVNAEYVLSACRGYKVRVKIKKVRPRTSPLPTHYKAFDILALFIKTTKGSGEIALEVGASPTYVVQVRELAKEKGLLPADR